MMKYLNGNLKLKTKINKINYVIFGFIADWMQFSKKEKSELDNRSEEISKVKQRETRWKRCNNGKENIMHVTCSYSLCNWSLWWGRLRTGKKQSGKIYE